MALFSEKSWDDWVHEYAEGHKHPINRKCHTIGIPMIVASILLLPFSLLIPSLWKFSLLLFVVGWIFQFVGHYYEKNAPEFFKDWRFLLVGTRWWLRKTFNGGK
ncbi:Mpo1-like protein [Agarilytica rhodophyticola]|uniref:Mpo1-like protein n=1 Tax=Agarilytica rhodophyticola TaxID=1737490 RepID=UPI000B3460BD|nr:DUF962 domain-containing protein [Agarilytica rhodophyticola]